MSDVYELVFEDISVRSIKSLLSEIDSGFASGREGRSAIDEYFRSVRDVDFSSKMSGTHEAFRNLNELRVRLYKYDQTFDCEISWFAESVSNCTIEKLKSFAEAFLKDHELNAVFCGLDPASDEDTQLFYCS